MSAAEMSKKALDGFIVARQLYTPQARVRAVSEVVGTWNSGGRGYMVSQEEIGELAARRLHPPLSMLLASHGSLQFRNGFRWDCNSTPRPPWCKD
jgi:hypothetical protein